MKTRLQSRSEMMVMVDQLETQSDIVQVQAPARSPIVPGLLYPLAIDEQPGLVPVATSETGHQTITQTPDPSKARAYCEDPRAEVQQVCAS